jgi:hypothetical protein
MAVKERPQDRGQESLLVVVVVVVVVEVVVVIVVVAVVAVVVGEETSMCAVRLRPARLGLDV